MEKEHDEEETLDDLIKDIGQSMQRDLEDTKRIEGGGPDYKYTKEDVWDDIKANRPEDRTDEPAGSDRNIAHLFRKPAS